MTKREKIALIQRISRRRGYCACMGCRVRRKHNYFLPGERETVEAFKNSET